jgi:hypothetical protein
MEVPCTRDIRRSKSMEQVAPVEMRLAELMIADETRFKRSYQTLLDEGLCEQKKRVQALKRLLNEPYDDPNRREGCPEKNVSTAHFPII